MKLNKPFSWLGILIILTSMLMIIPTGEVFAATLIINPTTAAVGQQVAISGGGYAPTSQVGVYFSSQNANPFAVIGTDITIFSYVGQFASDANGSITGTYTIPATFAQGGVAVIAGTYYLYSVQLDSSNPNTTLVKGTMTVQPMATLNAASPASGAPDTTVTLTGSNFLPNHAITIIFDSATITPLTGGTTSAAGVVSATFNVPYMAAGVHSITVSDTSSSPSTTFSITPYIAAVPQSGPTGTEVTIAGNGFGGVKSIIIYFNNQQVATTLSSTQGDLPNTKITIPDIGLVAGTYDIKAVDSNSNLGTAPFLLTVPTTTPTPTTTPASIQVTIVGTNVAIQGSNFAANAAISIWIEDDQVSSATASTTGSFSVQFEVPTSLSVGDHIISVTDGTTTKEYTYTKEASAEPNINVLTAGANMAVSGTRFLPNSKITISIDGEQIGTGITANTQGSFAVQFQIAVNLSGGDHIIAVTDGVNTEEYTYTVESTPPDIPVPISPEMGATPPKPFSFEWTSVSDTSSPVSYDIQVAADASFSASSILVDKADLTLPLYALTEGEQAKLAGRAEPYYWRVRAVDAASNESPWTGAIEVNVAAPTSFPGWLIYTLAGVGAIIIFGIGYLVGRRTAFYY